MAKETLGDLLPPELKMTKPVVSGTSEREKKEEEEKT